MFRLPIKETKEVKSTQIFFTNLRLESSSFIAVTLISIIAVEIC